MNKILHRYNLNTRSLYSTALASVLLCLLFTACVQHPEPLKPNFIIILTDDQGYGDVGIYGAQGFQTPNLDAMAARGIRFTDFYVPATVCTPARAALLTGCYPKRVGLHEAVLFPYSKHGLHPEEIILPELLRPLGYATACVGKWHLGHHPEFLPEKQGFGYVFSVPYSNDMDSYQYRNPPFSSPPLPLYENGDLIEEGPDQRYLTRRYTEAAVKFIEENRDRPFFLYLAHSMPHLPWHVSERFQGTSERGLYGDVIQEIDWSLGEILQTLRRNDLETTTLVIFTSDNGPVLGDKAGSAGPLRGRKAQTWEGGARVPCLALWPGYIPEGEVCHEIATVMGLLPTFVTLAGGRIPDDQAIDGFDISQLLREPRSLPSPYDALYYYSRDGTLEAIREGDWKLHTAKSRGWDTKQGQFPVSLYNLRDDIGETHNVAEQYPQLVKRLTEKMREFDLRLAQEVRPAGRALSINGRSPH
ncbi:MAG: sulfatase [Candidatus Aminicenantaceae bacterium]